MSTTIIRGISVSFPFEPYQIQKDYMEKVIESLQNETSAVLESPTGTGKTLSLLCASLAWLTAKKAQVQAERISGVFNSDKENDNDTFLQRLQQNIEEDVGAAGQNGRAFLGVPTIIYASRTHSQLSQAMQELKRTAYTHMKATVIGSREQMCIHPDVISTENHTAKIHMCKLKVQVRSCHFYNKVEKLKDDPIVSNIPVVDIEDIVNLGKKHKFCPYFMSKELKKQADIIFMPYNYLLDPLARKALGVSLANTVVILDEAHNIERICEDAASAQLKSTDITLCIDEVTDVMKAMSNEPTSFSGGDVPKDFTPEELCILKQMLLDLEKVVDNLQLTNSSSEGTTLEGSYIYEIFEKAGIQYSNSNVLCDIIDKIVQFLSTVHDGPFQRQGTGLMLLDSLLRIVFASPSPAYKEKIKDCCKIYLTAEETKKKSGSDWLSKAVTISKPGAKVINFWCFNPGFGMNMMMEQGIKSLILTSGTLAPLKPLISELDLDAQIQLENPHIVKGNQVCVKILNKGPDGIELNSSYQNRNKPEYISSLGRTILNLSRIIPNGLLIFFPSYPIMQKCQQEWQETGIWGNISDQKAIYVEPKQKEAFNVAMSEFYSRIQDPQYKGAIFMGVCRGKISEGLDFADANGRAVIIIGLPYPPFKDPRVVLKKQYLDLRRIKNREAISGNDWYSLEATRAVNQAIGRVIRHQYDYGAIILMDARFANYQVKAQMSMWLREHIKLANNFGEVIRDLRNFYRNAETNLPQPKLRPKPIQNTSAAEFDISQVYKRKGNFDFSTSACCSVLNETTASENLVKIHDRDASGATGSNGLKRRKIKIVKPNTNTTSESNTSTTLKEYIVMVKKALTSEDFKAFVDALERYRDTTNFNQLIMNLDSIFIPKPNLRYIIEGLTPYIKEQHTEKFDDYWLKMR